MAKSKSKRKKTRRTKSASGRTVRKSVARSATYNEEYAAILDSAQAALDGGDNVTAEESVKPLLTDEIMTSDGEAFLYASRIAAFAAEHRGDLDAARSYALAALDISPDLLDLNYLLVAVFVRLDESDLVLTYGKKYLALLKKIEKSKGEGFVLMGTSEMAHLVLYQMGTAEMNSGRFQKAIDHFRDALKSKKDFAEVYINLIRIAEHNKQGDDVTRLLNEGLSACPDSEELKMMQGTTAVDQPSLSACMIVKNEEEMLPRCLESIKDVCDEIVVVDTGSTDRTVEIAESFGAKVFHHEWENDFSKARNQSLSYATGDWILIIDADEVLVQEDVSMLRRILSETDHNLVSITVYNIGAENVLATSFLPSIRLFKRSLGAYYDGIVHNQLKFDEENNKVLRAGVRLEHFGYGLKPEQMKMKVARSRALLLKQLENDPNNAFANFNLAQLYRGESPNPSEEICDKIANHATRVIDNTDVNKRGERHLHLMALHQMVTAHFYKRELDEAESYCMRALEYKEDYLDPIISLGHIYSQKGDWDNARKWFLRYLDERARFNHSDETLQIILLNLESEHIAFYGLGIVSEAQARCDEAIDWFKKVTWKLNNYADVHLRLAQLYYNKQKYESAILEAHRELETHSDAWPAHYILGESYTKIGKVAAATNHLNEAHLSQPSNPDIMIALARLHLLSENYDDGGRIADEIESLVPDKPTAMKLAGDIRYARGDYRGAVRAYERAAFSGNADEEVWNNMGNSYFKLQQFDEAEKCYRNALAAKPDMALSVRNLGISLAMSGRKDEAVEKLATFLEFAPDDSAVAQILGDIMYEKGDLARAVKMYELCVSLEPGAYAVITKLADAYHRQGHLESARLGYMQALKIKSDYEPALAKLDQIESSTPDHA